MYKLLNYNKLNSITERLRMRHIVALAVIVTVAQTASQAAQSAEHNLALRTKYDCVVAPNYWGWKGPRHGNLGQLTDGKTVDSWRTAEGECYALSSSMGWNGTAPIVVFDLGSVRSIDGVGIHTALSPWGPWWPEIITVLVSDDNVNFYLAGQPVTVSPNRLDPPLSSQTVRSAIDRQLLSKGQQPSKHWLRINNLAAAGRYVAIMMSLPADTGTIVVDEIEIYAGLSKTSDAPRPKQVFSEGPAGWKSYRLFQAIDQRIARDIAALRKQIASSSIPIEERNSLQRDLNQLDAKRNDLPVPSTAAFRAQLPINDLHRQVFEVQAALWRAEQLPQLVVWHNHRWDPLPPIGRPDRNSPKLDIVIEKNAFRSDVLNISNADKKPHTITLTGFPHEHVDLFEVPFVDTHSLEPVATKLVPLTAKEGAYQVQVPAGMTRQIWIRCHSTKMGFGTLSKAIRLTSAHDPAWSADVPIRIETIDIPMPDEFSTYVGGWDYPSPGTYQVTDRNIDQYVSMLREYGVNTTWSADAMPTGAYNAAGDLIAPPSRAAMEKWLEQFPDAKLRACLATGIAPMDDPLRGKKIEAWARDWSAYLQAKQIDLNGIALLIRDEPISDDELKIILAVGESIKRGEPRFKIFNDLHWLDPTQAPPTIDAVMRRACDIQCFNVANCLNEPAANEKFISNYARPDLQWWCYSGGGNHRLTDPYVAWQLRFWFCFENGFTGAQFWAFGDGNGGFSDSEYFNDGPTRSPLYLTDDAVFASKSMEAMREGAQDYELLLKLKQSLIGQAGTDSGASRTLKQGVARVLKAHTLSKWDWNVPKDRSVADQVRIEILRALRRVGSTN